MANDFDLSDLRRPRLLCDLRKKASHQGVEAAEIWLVCSNIRHAGGLPLPVCLTARFQFA